MKSPLCRSLQKFEWTQFKWSINPHNLSDPPCQEQTKYLFSEPVFHDVKKPQPGYAAVGGFAVCSLLNCAPGLSTSYTQQLSSDSLKFGSRDHRQSFSVALRWPRIRPQPSFTSLCALMTQGTGALRVGGGGLKIRLREHLTSMPHLTENITLSHFLASWHGSSYSRGENK